MTTSTRIFRVALLAGTVAFAACSMTPQAPMMAATNTAAFGAVLSSAAEVPPNTSTGSGMLDATFDKNSNILRWTVTYSGLTGPATMAHFHGPAMAGANAGVAVPFPSAMSPARGETVLTAAQVADLMAGKWYANVHTAAHPGGEIRGQVMAK